MNDELNVCIFHSDKLNNLCPAYLLQGSASNHHYGDFVDIQKVYSAETALRDFLILYLILFIYIGGPMITNYETLPISTAVHSTRRNIALRIEH